MLDELDLETIKDEGARRAIVMLLNYMFATWNLGFQWQGLNQSLIAIAFTCMVTGAGRVFGLDVSNAFKNPKSVWW